MESSFEFVRRYWNPAAVLDALDIKAWPPSVDEVDGSLYEAAQHQPAPGQPRRGDVRSCAPDTCPAPATAAAAAFSPHHLQQNQKRPRPASPSRRFPWLCPRDAAVRIQRLYRGHRVREAKRRVQELEEEVGAVETRIMASLEQILGDDRERKRVNEMIMNILLRLDGVGAACREYRKSVIKKAINLQESLDCLVGENGRGGGGGDVAQPKRLAREQDHRDSKENEGDRPDDDREEGNSSHDEDEDDEGSRGCRGVKEALDRVMEENAMLHGLVRDLLDRNDQQSRLVCQLSERVEYLEKKLQRLGRKRRRSRHGESGGGGSGGGGSGTSSCSAGEEDGPDAKGKDGCDNAQKISGRDRDDGGCER